MTPAQRDQLITHYANKTTPHTPEDLAHISELFNQPRLTIDQWKQATTIRELCTLTTQSMFCEHDIRGDAAYWFDEVIEIACDLAVINQTGVLTLNSQPGGTLTTGITQHAYLSAATTRETAHRITTAINNIGGQTDTREWGSQPTPLPIVSTGGREHRAPGAATMFAIGTRRWGTDAVIELLETTVFVTVVGGPTSDREFWNTLTNACQ